MSYKGKLNIYTCEQCKSHVVTKDIDEGVTPFLIPARNYCPNKCDNRHVLMQSSLYRVYDQTMKHDYEWYSPTAEEAAKLAPAAKDHVLKGGLILRKAE